MKLQKIFGMLVMILMLTSIAIADDGNVVGPVAEFDTYVTVVDDEIIGVETGATLWDKLFSGGELNFVALGVESAGTSLCTKSAQYGDYSMIAGEERITGGKCRIGDYIVFKSTGGDISSGRVLFDNMWFRSSTSDLPNLKNYYLADKTFTYSYACYSCSGPLNTQSSEKGCLNTGATACVSADSSTCKTDYEFEKVCLQHIGESTQTPTTTGKAVDIKAGKTNKNEYEVGETIYIRGWALINSNVRGAVIETSLELPDYATVTDLSVTSGIDKGVCGDDKTTGVKFDANAGSEVGYTLRLTATKPGNYQVKVISAEGCGKGISDSYSLAQFKIVEGATIINTDSQDETVTDGTQSEDLTDDREINFDDLNDIESTGSNDIKIVNVTEKEPFYIEWWNIIVNWFKGLFSFG